MRLIDADGLAEYWHPDRARYFEAAYFIHTIETAKTVDAVPVIRCKDCVYGEEYINGRRDYLYCTVHDGNVDINGYCSNAEKRRIE